MADRYPEGKLTQTDEGELAFKILCVDGRIILDWGRPTQWIGLTPSDARDLADALIRKAQEAETEGEG